MRPFLNKELDIPQSVTRRYLFGGNLSERGCSSNIF